MVYYILFYPQELASAWTQAWREARPQLSASSISNQGSTAEDKSWDQNWAGCPVQSTTHIQEKEKAFSEKTVQEEVVDYVNSLGDPSSLMCLKWIIKYKTKDLEALIREMFTSGENVLGQQTVHVWSVWVAWIMTIIGSYILIFHPHLLNMFGKDMSYGLIVSVGRLWGFKSRWHL